jgi:branched-chain amino acid transport system ATP-binding protein
MVRRGIAHVPEGRGVVTELTVDENLRLGGLWRRDKADIRRAMDEVYQLFEPLARRRRSPGHQLSGGERQMLALGRALVGRPRLLLLDEPSLGLAPKVTAQIMALLRTLRDSTGLTVLLVEQNVRSALSIADEGVVMALGRIVTRRDAASLRADDDLRHSYLGF